MIKRLLLTSIFVPVFSAFSQTCIDSSLINPTIECIALLQPVCGCDGVTYGNSCIAVNYYGITEFSNGPCPLQEPDTCIKIPAGINFGACASILGWCRIGDECIELSGCSMLGSDGIDYSNYFYGSSYACNSLCSTDTVVFLNCIDSSLINIGVQIPDIYQPVCGCDSVTYQNSSLAIYYHGVSNYYEGECATASNQEIGESNMNIVPNPISNHFSIKQTTNQLMSIKLVAIDGRPMPIAEMMNNDFYILGETTTGIAFLEIVDYKGKFTRYKILIEK
jgi:hypothetical protein